MGKSMNDNFGNEQFSLLERLSNASSVSGDEIEVRQIIIDEIKNDVDRYSIDSLGNLLAIKSPPGPPRLRVMVAAHMDEVGFMITDKGDDGLYRFDKIGGIPVNTVAGKPVLIGKDKIPGVIGTKAIHLVKEEDLEQPLSLDQLRIDTGPEINGKVKLGDYAVFATQFQKLGSSMMGKAFDDRLGVASLIALLKKPPSNIEIMAAFTVKEELGLRGAGSAAYSLQPDLALVLDATPAYDFPVWDKSENYIYNTRLDFGPAIYVADRATLSDPRLVNHFVMVAEKNEIIHQIRQPGEGGTDAGAIHLQRSGIPSISISVPTRYIHSPISVARISDWENTFHLVFLGLEALTESVLDRG
jgi:tetrahedral aminopeptidase